MGIAWRLVKTVSKLNPTWRARVKQFENFHREDHYYSPIPNIDEVRRAEHRIFDRTVRELASVDLNMAGQVQMLGEIEKFYGELPFPEQPSGTTRYHFNNKYFPYSDGVFYFGMLRHIKPKQIVEVGSGFTSALCLDTNEKFFNNTVRCVFIDPNTGRLESLLRSEDRKAVKIIPAMVQDVSLSEFQALRENDILFIDSSHISKVGSDLNHILFEILPALHAGVYIHFHDIYYPFEYPKIGIYRGGAGNEVYILRAFLQYNKAYRIVAWNDFLELYQTERIKKNMPLCKRNSGSFWMQKL